jgi:hypothetical protein
MKYVSDEKHASFGKVHVKKCRIKRDSMGCMPYRRFSSVYFFRWVITIPVDGTVGAGLETPRKKAHIYIRLYIKVQSHNGVMTVMAAAHATRFLLRRAAFNSFLMICTFSRCTAAVCVEKSAPLAQATNISFMCVCAVPVPFCQSAGGHHRGATWV